MVLVIDDEDCRNSVLNTYLNYWYDKKQVYSLDKYSDAKDPRVIDYRSWRGKFGSNETLFENEVLQNVSDAYKAEVDKLSKGKAKHCETISDLIRLVCSISPDLLIGTDDEITDILNPIKSYGFVFDAEQLTKPGNISEAFARFIYELASFISIYLCKIKIQHYLLTANGIYLIFQRGFIHDYQLVIV